MQIQVTQTERDTILAALRSWTRQRWNLNLNSQHDQMLNEIETNGGEHHELTDEEIDELCERINV